jgi:hypothetical protein
MILSSIPVNGYEFFTKVGVRIHKWKKIKIVSHLILKGQKVFTFE